MTRRRLKVFFDGGCRPNPGPVEAAVVIRGIPHLFDDLGIGNNRDAEWLALIRAMELTRTMGLSGVELIGDAVEIITKANRVLTSGESSDDHEKRFLALAVETTPARVRWIKRAQNLAGITLAARHPR